MNTYYVEVVFEDGTLDKFFLKANNKYQAYRNVIKRINIWQADSITIKRSGVQNLDN